METFDWGETHPESPEAIEEALASVRTRGDKKKNQHRAAALGTTSLIAITAAISLVAFNGGSGTKPQQVAPPLTTGTSPTPTTQLQLSLAARVIQTAQTALANTHSIGATESSVIQTAQAGQGLRVGDKVTTTYRISADGSFRASRQLKESGSEGINYAAYSAKTGIVETCEESNGKYSACDLMDGPYPIDMNLSQVSSDLNYFVAAVAQASSGTGPQATETTVNGQKYWTLDFETHPDSSTTKEHVSLLIDQQSGFPVHLTTTVDGKTLKDVTLSNLEINTPYTAADLTLSPPKGTAVRNDVNHVGSVVGESTSFGPTVTQAQRKLLPVSTIDAFTTDEVWTTVHGAPPYVNGACLQSTNGVTQLDQESRSGLLSYEIKTVDLATCPDAPQAEDIGQDFANPTRLKSGRVSSGAMKGATFDVYRNSAGSTFTIVKNNTLWMAITGDLTVDQSVDVANGFVYQQ